MVRNTGLFFSTDLNSYSCVQVCISTLSDLPLQFTCCLLWELYELNFRHELYTPNQVLVLNPWATSDQASLAHQALFYSIFPGSTWSEPDLLEESSQVGSTINMNNFHELLSVWPGATHHLKFPAESDSQENTTEWDLFLQPLNFIFRWHLIILDDNL